MFSFVLAVSYYRFSSPSASNTAPKPACISLAIFARNNTPTRAVAIATIRLNVFIFEFYFNNPAIEICWARGATI